MPADRLRLPADVRDALHERRDAGAPAEVCGVLLGDRAGDAGAAAETPAAGRVAEAVPVDNVADDPERFYELDPAETVAAIEDGEDRGLDVIGFYHSHPRGPAAPSETDRDRATWTGYVYAIVAPETVVAYRWTREAFRRLRVETP
ncbi:desampylase [Halobaculum gomorrense]|uniref:Proteasome lid subunit RPN8/RPN11, contains Jab1/MPN metalloenzyme (JAMM) motif n=1 Tax=Halobaculum gomorrense TaxID=43928 RepID=A0A1M5MBX6_9EURY|nr:desampylase [Halobaculum gomorrense]SHG74776.1 Proteasome lid subunit RPN8/RPN11, contains Jab1/MPN metalloenzyme (JAMM) motif [Halobaculum gomorrense]